jgi:hypothetical protein
MFVFFAIYTGLLTAINCNNVKWATRVQDIFTGTKILALVIIVVAGLWELAYGKTENLQNPMANTNPDPGFIALAFYSGLFSYSGWWVCFILLNTCKIQVLCLSIIPSIFERKVYRRILCPVYDNEQENLRILTNKQLYAIVKKHTIIETIRLHKLCWFGLVERMEENRSPKRVLYMNLVSIRPSGRPRNRWQDEVREDGRIVGGEQWQEKVYNREEWQKLLRTRSNRRILHMTIE